jgi:outer membrane lipoprotein SlyB
MKKHFVTTFGTALLIVAAGCYTPEGREDRTATGALAGGAIGAGTGAIIGSQSGHAGTGALIGGMIGALTGGIIGNAMDQQQRETLEQSSPQTMRRIERGAPLTLADVKALSRAGVSDDIIISQIRNSRTVFYLNTSEIIELKEAGVSNRVIDTMINTPGLYPPPPPPPPRYRGY